MVGNNDESETRLHPPPRPYVNRDIPMASLRERLETLRPRNGNRSHSEVDETNSPTGAELTNDLLLELLRKQREQL